jgi:fatty acid desaturase
MNGERNPVTVVDFDIPFGRMVAFFVKASLAAIPAAIIVWVILWLIAAVLVALLGHSFRPFQV